MGELERSLSKYFCDNFKEVTEHEMWRFVEAFKDRLLFLNNLDSRTFKWITTPNESQSICFTACICDSDNVEESPRKYYINRRYLG